MLALRWLKPYGFPIHGCIDWYVSCKTPSVNRIVSACKRFSRRIQWLELATTYNDPSVVVKHYLDAVMELEGKCIYTLYLTFIRVEVGGNSSSLFLCVSNLQLTF